MTTPTPKPGDLRDRIARSLVAGDTGSDAYWSDMTEATREVYQRLADDVLMVVAPELARLREQFAPSAKAAEIELELRQVRAEAIAAIEEMQRVTGTLRGAEEECRVLREDNLRLRERVAENNNDKEN